jgi:hypothetical protein
MTPQGRKWLTSIHPFFSQKEYSSIPRNHEKKSSNLLSCKNCLDWSQFPGLSSFALGELPPKENNLYHTGQARETKVLLSTELLNRYKYLFFKKNLKHGLVNFPLVDSSDSFILLVLPLVL